MKIIFTDLDGTLLDHNNYSFSAAKKGLKILLQQHIPLIFCTSKTKAEIIYWRKKIKNHHPFISENGGGLFIPIDYFSFCFEYNQKDDSYYLIRFGAPKDKLKKVMRELEQKFNLESFLSMDTNTLMEKTDLTLKQANLASKREFDIPFVLYDEKEEKRVIKYIYDQGLQCTKGGRFYHLMGDNDKGKAVSKLIRLFKRKFDSIDTIGIGDSENDFSMLTQVDHGYLVKKPDNTFASNEFNHSDGIGPAGWQNVIEKELNR